MEWTPFLPSKQHIYGQLPETGQSHFIYESGVGMFLTIRFYTRIASAVKVSYLQPFQVHPGYCCNYPSSRQKLRYMLGLFGELCQAFLFEEFRGTAAKSSSGYPGQ